MSSLAETQATLRRAIVAPEVAEAVLPMLAAPRGARRRLAIYQRHYHESLGRHLLGRFPTVEWLLGSQRMRALVDAFIRVSPPKAPCMAEYGVEFTNFIAWDRSTHNLPYLEDAAWLDWHLGDVAVAVDRPPLQVAALRAFPQDRLPDLAMTLQAGTRYLGSGWPVDDLVRVKLSENAPGQLTFNPVPVALEIRGSRGRFDVGRLDPATFKFRSAIGQGKPLGVAMQRALETDPEFDVPHGLASLFADGLVVAVSDPASGGNVV
ncbi:MAG: DNA-binding domain-containing protein [Devosia sp.]|nr:DNA-binding domain-containing protein [Devosia sp.]